MNWCHLQDVVHLSPTGSWDKTPIRNIVMDGSEDRKIGGWMALDFGFKVLLWRNCGYEFFFRFMEMYKYKCSRLPEKFYHLWRCVTHPRSFAPHLSFQDGVPVPDVPLSFSCSVSSSSGNFLTAVHAPQFLKSCYFETRSDDRSRETDNDRLSLRSTIMQRQAKSIWNYKTTTNDNIECSAVFVQPDEGVWIVKSPLGFYVMAPCILVAAWFNIWTEKKKF